MIGWESVLMTVFIQSWNRSGTYTLVQYVTIFKRSNALFPDNANLITIGMLLGQVVAQALPIINIALIFMGCTLLFKNSDIENHKG